MAPSSPDYQQDPAQLYRILQRLLQYSRANIPALLARRSIGSFTRQHEAPPPQATHFSALLVYPQNPFAGGSEIRRLHSSDIQPGLINERVQLRDSLGSQIVPDADGNYLYPEDSPEFEALNAFYYATFTLRTFERYARRALPWAFNAKRITLDPRVGSQGNAFYNEQEGILGFHTYQSSDGRERSTAQSADVVSHETAHAILDGLRDLQNESFGLGCRAFHESFGDMGAILVALHDDVLVHRLLEWTRGKLRATNFVTELAEYLTAELRAGSDRVLAKTVYLRNAFNKLRAVPFDDLKYQTIKPELTLTRQEHNYSRLFTGAFYDALVGVYEHLAQDQPAIIALYRAREVLGRLLVLAVEVGPVGELDFSDMARAFLTAETLLYQGRYQTILRAVFSERSLLSEAGAAEHMAQQALLPKLRLPRLLNNSMDAALFLQSEVLSALRLPADSELIPMQGYRRADGWQFLTYFAPRQITLKGAQYQQYDGVPIDLFGGLTLVFDAEDRLCSACYRPVTDEDVRQIEIITAELIGLGRLTNQMFPLANIPSPRPKGLLLRVDAEQRLIKYPVIFDNLVEQLHGLVSFLQAWQQQQQLPGE